MNYTNLAVKFPMLCPYMAPELQLGSHVPAGSRAAAGLPCELFSGALLMVRQTTETKFKVYFDQNYGNKV